MFVCATHGILSLQNANWSLIIPQFETVITRSADLTVEALARAELEYETLVLLFLFQKFIRKQHGTGYHQVTLATCTVHVPQRDSCCQLSETAAGVCAEFCMIRHSALPPSNSRPPVICFRFLLSACEPATRLSIQRPRRALQSVTSSRPGLMYNP